MNDSDREEWIDNDEGLYRWWRNSRMTYRVFIRTFRTEIDKYIESQLKKTYENILR